MGEIVTFYSYKGGGGRSLTLANVAWALASNGARVLVMDWDLEAPGLHRYFHPFLGDPELAGTDGLIDHLWRYASAVSDGEPDASSRWADLSDVTVNLDVPAGMDGSLSFIGAGRQDDDYSRKVTGFDWPGFYERLDGAEFFKAVEAWMRRSYDFVLIDSRTGVSDSAGVCTVQLPDVVVMTMVYNRQSIEGTAAVARSIEQNREEQGRPIRLVVVPTKVEDRTAAGVARRFAALRLHRLMGRSIDDAERDLRLAEIKHHAWCNYEEKLAIFEEDPDERGTLLADMHALASNLGRIERIRHFDQDELRRLWRRAAFADPRVSDISLLGDVSSEDAIDLLSDWAAQAEADPSERVDWLSTLASRCVEVPNRTLDPDLTEVAHALADRGIALARRAAVRGNASAMQEFGRLLLIRANQQQSNGAIQEALRSLDEANAILAGEGVGPHALLLARATEWQANLMDRIDDHLAARSLWQRASKIYRQIASSDPMRTRDSLRVLHRLTESLRRTEEAEDAFRDDERASLAGRRGPVRPQAESDVTELEAIEASLRHMAERAEGRGTDQSDDARALRGEPRHVGEE